MVALLLVLASLFNLAAGQAGCPTQTKFEAALMGMYDFAAADKVLNEKLGVLAGAGAPSAVLASGITVSVDTAYMNTLGDASAMADGSLTGAELTADPDAAALVAALQEQIAQQMGIDPSMVTITSVGTGGRRRMEGDGPMRVSIDYSVQVLTLSEAAEVRSLFDSVEVDATSR